jgi:hypothetical protein
VGKVTDERTLVRQARILVPEMAAQWHPERGSHFRIWSLYSSILQASMVRAYVHLIRSFSSPNTDNDCRS